MQRPPRTALLDKGDPRFPFIRYSTPVDEAAKRSG